MTSERDTSRIVQTWLETGSTGLPDRVLDAVLSELPSTPQRRHVWSSWRPKYMTPLIRIAALAAILLVAAAGALLVGGAGILRPAPTPAPTRIPVSGSVTIVLGGQRKTNQVSATATGTSMTGSVVFDRNNPLFTLGLECLRRVDDDTWLFGGHVTSTTSNGPPVGHGVAFILRDGAQRQSGGWFEDPPYAADCLTLVANIDLAKLTEPSWLSDVVESDLDIPAGLGH